jgi:TRAP-type transport system small permease protein
LQLIRAYINVMEKVNKVLYWIVGVLLAGIFILLVSQVFFRYVISISVSWTEEAARFLTVWSVFIGTAIALRTKSLIAVEVVVQLVPKKIEKIFRIIVLLLSMILLIYLIFLGSQLSMNAVEQDSTALGISMWIPYAAIPVGSFFAVLNVFVVVIEIITGKEEQTA